MASSSNRAGAGHEVEPSLDDDPAELEPRLVRRWLNDDLEIDTRLGINQTGQQPSRAINDARREDMASNQQPSTDCRFYTFEEGLNKILLVESNDQPPPESAKSMDPELYISATSGNIDAFKRKIEDTEISPLENQVSPRGNTVLHLAAWSGHEMLVKFIVQQSPGLVNCLNKKGEHALHLAASCGHLTTVKSLKPDNNVLKVVNNEGKTALFVALENRHQEVAEFLATPGLYQKYLGKKSPLYTADIAGYRELVKLFMDEKPDESNNQNEGSEGHSDFDPSNNQNEGSELIRQLKLRLGNSDFDPYLQLFYINFKGGGKTLLHAAIMGKKRDVLDMIYSDSSLTYPTFDHEGRTPLSFAAYIGYLEGVQYLLDKCTAGVYQRDLVTGAFPIHTAARKGYIEIVQEFLKRCPDSKELLDSTDRNILHVAAMFGKAKVVSYMLKKPELKMLINERDYKGDTPLHLATKYWHPKVVSILTWDKRVRLEAENNDGLTAMDVAVKNLETADLFRKQLTLIALRSANAPLTLIALGSANAPPSEQSSTMRTTPESYSSLDKPNMEHYRERVNTLLVVSTLVATVTFAAAFTRPGGNNDSDPNEVMAGLIRKSAFQAFFIFNTIAMYSAITVVITLIFAQVADLNLTRKLRTKPESCSSLEKPNMEYYRERVNTLLLVSTLVATVTFAAAFTRPGGNNDSNPNEVMAGLIRKSAFQAFFLFNTIAMYIAITVVITLSFAQVADLNLILTALNLALPLLGVAVTMMSLAFMVATYLVVPNLYWLAIAVLIVSIIFLVILLALFILLYSLFYSNHSIVRYIFYYPFCLMIWATGSDMDRKKD